ncbi:COMPASS complex subunit Sdc1 [Aspergillus sp. HF37]|nr:COMPASS complex subunit Sdc1 [Aspergillus sp. HF37]
MSNPGTDPTLSGGAGSNTPMGEAHSTPTSQPRPGGAPIRTYLNERIVPYLLEGMKTVAKDQPSNPLRMLGEFLIQKSDEIEGGAACKKEPPE